MSGNLVQILSHDGYLWALDESGEVWWLDGPDKGQAVNWDWKSAHDDHKRSASSGRTLKKK